VITFRIVSVLPAVWIACPAVSIATGPDRWLTVG
jgi:hypothetical protein